jgi:putative transposase
MGMIYSIDLRERVIAFIESGGKKLEASRRFNVSRLSIDRWLVLLQETGSLKTPLLKPRRWRKLNPETLLAYVKTHPDLMLEDYATHFHTSPSGIWRALKRLKVTRKKRPLSTRNEMRISVQHFWSR